jgi:hypothetical protein
VSNPDAELVFAPARPGRENWLVAIAGPSGSGKTFSALRLARGIAGPGGTIGLVDTENKRSLFYARDFGFERAFIEPPYRPEKYVRGAELSRKAGHSVLIIDSMSHEHSGIGGMIEWHEEELQRMAGEDWSKREKMTMAAWIKPKASHKAMMARLLALNTMVIFCLRAERKIEIVKNDKGKLVPVDIGFQPICGKDFMYDMTISMMLSEESPGVPTLTKANGRHRELFIPGKQLDEAAGARIAAYARGDAQQPVPAAAPAQAPGKHAGPPTPAPDLVPEPTSPKPARRPTVSQVATDLLNRFRNTMSAEEHREIAEDQVVHERLKWLHKNHPALWDSVNEALIDSIQRHSREAVNEPVD